MYNVDFIERRWELVKADLPVATIVKARVEIHFPFGAFVNLGFEFVGLIRSTRLRDGGVHVAVSDFPPVGSDIEAVVLSFNDRNKQIELSTRPSDMARSRGFRTYFA